MYTKDYTLSLHDALPILCRRAIEEAEEGDRARRAFDPVEDLVHLQAQARSEEHTSELQSLRHLVCRLLLEKKYQLLSEAHALSLSLSLSLSLACGLVATP